VSILRPALFLVLAWAAAPPVAAEVFYSREAALRLAFPGADSLSVQDYTLSADQVRQAEKLGSVRVASRLVSAYRGWSKGELLGTAYFDTHTVRTLPETILLVLDPAGATRAIHLLAFHEPPEYRPSPDFLIRFRGRALAPGLGVGRDVAGIAGSTLTSYAITGAVRRLLAVHQVVHGAGSATGSGMARLP
jgi:hypothetical protein